MAGERERRPERRAGALPVMLMMEEVTKQTKDPATASKNAAHPGVLQR